MKGQTCEVQGTCSFHLCLSGPGEIFMGGKSGDFVFCRCVLQQQQAAHIEQNVLATSPLGAGQCGGAQGQTAESFSSRVAGADTSSLPPRLGASSRALLYHFRTCWMHPCIPQLSRVTTELFKVSPRLTLGCVMQILLMLGKCWSRGWVWG